MDPGIVIEVTEVHLAIPIGPVTDTEAAIITITMEVHTLGEGKRT